MPIRHRSDISSLESSHGSPSPNVTKQLFDNMADFGAEKISPQMAFNIYSRGGGGGKTSKQMSFISGAQTNDEIKEAKKAARKAATEARRVARAARRKERIAALGLSSVFQSRKQIAASKKQGDTNWR